MNSNISVGKNPSSLIQLMRGKGGENAEKRFLEQQRKMREKVTGKKEEGGDEVKRYIEIVKKENEIKTVLLDEPKEAEFGLSKAITILEDPNINKNEMKDSNLNVMDEKFLSKMMVMLLKQETKYRDTINNFAPEAVDAMYNALNDIEEKMTPDKLVSIIELQMESMTNTFINLIMKNRISTDKSMNRTEQLENEISTLKVIIGDNNDVIDKDKALISSMEDVITGLNMQIQTSGLTEINSCPKGRRCDVATIEDVDELNKFTVEPNMITDIYNEIIEIKKHLFYEKSRCSDELMKVIINLIDRRDRETFDRLAEHGIYLLIDAKNTDIMHNIYITNSVRGVFTLNECGQLIAKAVADRC